VNEEDEERESEEKEKESSTAKEDVTVSDEQTRDG
jgi:hypothetical protein